MFGRGKSEEAVKDKPVAQPAPAQKAETPAEGPYLDVVPANIYHVHALEALLARGIEESKGLLPPYEPYHTYHHALKLIQIGTVYVLTEIDEEKKRDRVVGCLMLDAQSHSWNPGLQILRSVHFYIVPEYRAKRMPDGRLPFSAMIEVAKGLAYHVQMPLVIESFHQAGDERANVKDGLFERSGMAYVGGFFAFLPPQREQQEKAA